MIIYRIGTAFDIAVYIRTEAVPIILYAKLAAAKQRNRCGYELSGLMYFNGDF